MSRAYFRNPTRIPTSGGRLEVLHRRCGLRAVPGSQDRPGAQMAMTRLLADCVVAVAELEAIGAARKEWAPSSWLGLVASASVGNSERA
jgi:hypothetical protein